MPKINKRQWLQRKVSFDVFVANVDGALRRKYGVTTEMLGDTAFRRDWEMGRGAKATAERAVRTLRRDPF